LTHSDEGYPGVMTRPLDGLLTRPSGSRWLLALPPLDVTTSATVHNATALRRAFRRWVQALVEDDDANDLTLAVYEALANAAEHAYPAQREPGSMRLHATAADGQITVTITDNGTWRPPAVPTGRRGRGLPLMHKLTDEAHVEPNRQGTTVLLRHPLPLQQTA
jgi:serine/threonine-protein kinase RsbW